MYLWPMRFCYLISKMLFSTWITINRYAIEVNPLKEGYNMQKITSWTGELHSQSNDQDKMTKKCISAIIQHGKEARKQIYLKAIPKQLEMKISKFKHSSKSPDIWCLGWLHTLVNMINFHIISIFNFKDPTYQMSHLILYNQKFDDNKINSVSINIRIVKYRKLDDSETSYSDNIITSELQIISFFNCIYQFSKII